MFHSIAKYDRKGLENLGYKNFSKAFEDIANKLNSNRNTINNRRDDFDPLFEYRAGWHQRELSPRKLAIVDNFNHLSEIAFTEIVRDILSIKDYKILDFLKEESEDYTYSIRGITGKKAEEIFSTWFSNMYPNMNLVDTRDAGCGYDFFVEETEEAYEIKGLSGDYGGILLTDKEWSIANKLGSKYHLVLIKNCFSEHELIIYTNPATIFSPTKNITTTININWSISPSELK